MVTERRIDKDVFFEKVGYSPHDLQWPYHNSSARFRIPCCGRRFGKTQMVGHDLAADMFIPDTYNWIVGTTYKTGEKEFRVVYNDLVRKLGMHKIKGFKKSYNVKQGDMRIEMPWNTILEVVSADHPDSLVGEGLDRVVLSEAALHTRQIWDQYIEPALSDKLGIADLPSTPRGNNWYKGMYQLGQSDNDPEYGSWRFPTWFNNVMYPGGFSLQCPNIIENGQHFYDVKTKCTCNSEIVRIFNKVSRMYFLQEYAAEFTALEGKIYSEFDETVHVKRIEYTPAWENWLAFDFGFSDPFCCYDIMVDPSDNVYIWREYQVRYKSTYEHCVILQNRLQPDHYHVDRVAADPRGADEIATLELMLNYQVEANGDISWEKGVEAVRRWLKIRGDGKPKLFIDPSCVELIRQIGDLTTPKISETNQKNQERKPGTRNQRDYDDHGPDAIRYFFNEWEVQRSGSLEDLYDPSLTARTEAEGFFTHKTSVTRELPIGY
jgi:hypothetical protein